MFFKKKNGKDDPTWKFISSLAALVMTVVYAVWVSNIVYNYIPMDSPVLAFLSNMVYYGPIVICAATAVGAISHKGFVARIIVLAIWVLIVLFSFFPETFYSIIG